MDLSTTPPITTDPVERVGDATRRDGRPSDDRRRRPPRRRPSRPPAPPVRARRGYVDASEESPQDESSLDLLL